MFDSYKFVQHLHPAIENYFGGYFHFCWFSTKFISGAGVGENLFLTFRTPLKIQPAFQHCYAIQFVTYIILDYLTYLGGEYEAGLEAEDGDHVAMEAERLKLIPNLHKRIQLFSPYQSITPMAKSGATLRAEVAAPHLKPGSNSDKAKAATDPR